jgi:hypothetical protein
MRQLFLDLGQKDFAGSVCKECGMRYDKSFPDDIKLHKKYHADKAKMTWKKSEITLITLRLDDHEWVSLVRIKTRDENLNTMHKRVIMWIENSLSSVQVSHDKSLIYLLLDSKRNIVGFLSAAEKREANLIDDNGNVLKPITNCKFTVLLIWIEEFFRRKKLAQVMIKGMCLKESVDPQYISFHSPNELGTKLARTVYNQNGFALINNIKV